MEPDNALLDREIQDDCVATVTAIFPDICPEYLEALAAPLLYSTESVVNHIADAIEQGQPYTRQRAPSRKRKRPEDGQDSNTSEIQSDAEEDPDDDVVELLECQCCYTLTPINRLVYCQSQPSHPFCIECARQYAEHQVGMNKYEITCFATDECQAKFSQAQQSRFVDEKLQQALDRIEQDTVLRLANLEDLAICPFCPYAAEYPPIEHNREFRCDNPECQIVSCRLCQKESHIPKTCQEAAEEKGAGKARLLVEEAMTEALVRRCNKCQTPFIKIEGCNKMTCTRLGCYNIQCYICSKSCDYDHFTTRGPCPLWDKVEERHDKETKEAEEAAIQKVLAEHPDMDPELLRIKVSENVNLDDERRRKADADRAAKREGRRGGRNMARAIVAGVPMPRVVPARHQLAREATAKKVPEAPKLMQPPQVRVMNPLAFLLHNHRRPEAAGGAGVILKQPEAVEQMAQYPVRGRQRPGGDAEANRQQGQQPTTADQVGDPLQLVMPNDLGINGAPQLQQQWWAGPSFNPQPLPFAALAQGGPSNAPALPVVQDPVRVRTQAPEFGNFDFFDPFPMPPGLRPDPQASQQQNITQPIIVPTVVQGNAGDQVVLPGALDMRRRTSARLRERLGINRKSVTQEVPKGVPAAVQQIPEHGLGLGDGELPLGRRYGALAGNPPPPPPPPPPDPPQNETGWVGNFAPFPHRH